MRGTDRPDVGEGGPLELIDRYPVTFGALAANVALYIFAATRSGGLMRIAGEVNLQLGANVWPLTPHEPWRLLTHAFLHHDLLHLVFNTLAILSIGRILEVHLGSARLWVCYVASALAGGVFSAGFQALRGSALSVGASGAAFGLILCGFVYSTRAPERLGTLALSLRSWLVSAGIFSLLLFNQLDHAAHVGGAAAGALFGWRFDTRPREPHRLWAPLSHLLALVCLAAFAAVVLRMRAGEG